MAEFGISYNAETGELTIGDVTREVSGRWERILLGEQAPPNGWGNAAQWDSRATTWLRSVTGRTDVSVHVFSITPAPPRVSVFIGDPNPPANWWAEERH